MDEPLTIHIKDLNRNIVCYLCAGYYVDATTITECLHTFCKSCIVKFLQSNKNCPQCNTKIHETQPLLHLRADRVMQDIVFKLVPGLYEQEESRKHEFYKSRGLVKEKHEEQEHTPSLSTVCKNLEAHRYRHDELIVLCLERHFHESELPVLPKKFVRCSIRTRTHHLKILLTKKLHLPPNIQVDLLCNDEVLGKDMCMKEIHLTHWYTQSSPMIIQYRTYRPQSSLLDTMDGPS